jgi:menaquinone-dependent protoporphyrinogen oxidase
MTRILVIYGTTDGHTAKVANAIGRALRFQQVHADVVDAREAPPAPEAYHGVIVAASVQAGRYQRPVRTWVRAHAATLAKKPTAFVSVCLGVLQQDPGVHRHLQAIVDRFEGDTGWHPGEVKQVAGALLYTHYNWLKRWVLLRIVRKAGGATDTSQDYEYTDWADLRAFVDQFARKVRAQAGERHEVDRVA